MKDFFHYNARRRKNRLKYFLGLTLLPPALCFVIAALVILVNMRTYHSSGLLLPTVRIICYGTVCGIILAWTALSRTEKKTRRNARYSFVDIGLKEIVFSKYAGEYISDGKRIVLRELSVIPLSSLSSLGIDERNGKTVIVCDGAPIRSYEDRDDRLMYRFSSGKAVFDYWWYNENCTAENTEISLPPLFGNPEHLCAAIVSAKKRFDEMPLPRKYVHKELDFVKRKKALRLFKKLNEHLY